MNESPKAVVFACSHKAGGNSDVAARLFAQGVRDAGGDCTIQYLRQFDILPCLDCHRCMHDSGCQCFRAERDQSGQLFSSLFTAPVLFISSPIYFYHLPSIFKTLIDRTQSYYLRRENSAPALISLPERKAHVALIAGRPTGDKLFEGSELTLKYFLQPFNILLQPTIEIRGKDDPKALVGDLALCDHLRETGSSAWMEYLASRNK